MKNYNVQSVLIERKHYPTLGEAVQMLTSMGYNYYKHDITPHYFRFRQMDPSQFKGFFTKKGPKGVELVIGY
jgi:hypothetical protein